MPFQHSAKLLFPAPDGPVTPKVNRLVMAATPPDRENNDLKVHGMPDVWELRPMYEYLIGIDPTTGKREPQIATEWSISPDGKAYTFKLRPGVRYHGENGEVTSKDVAKAFWDIVQPDSIHGSSKYWLALVDRVDDSNPQTAVLHLKKPDAQAIGNISAQLTGIELKSTKQYDQLGRTPTLQEGPLAGSGPYQYKDRRQGEFIRFERVPYQHWRQQAAFPELEIRFIREASTRLAGLLTGEIHMTPLPEDLLAQAQKSSMQVVKGTVPGVRAFLQFRGAYLADRKNPNSGQKYPNSPLADVRVRKALNKAVNRDELNKSVFGGKGQLMYNNHHAPTRPGWNPDWEKRFQEEYGYDVAAAKKLLAEAGQSNLKTTMLVSPVAGLSGGEDLAEAVAGYLRAVGITVDMQTIDPAEFVNKRKLLGLQNQIGFAATGSNIWSGYTIWNSALATRGMYESMKVNHVLQEIEKTIDEGKREALWRQAGDLQYAEYMNINLFQLPVEVMVNPKVVSDWAFPGAISGAYTHMFNIKAAK